MSLLGFKDAKVFPPGPSAASLAGQSPMSQHFRPPEAKAPPRRTPPPAPAQPAPDGGLVPDDYDPFADNSPGPVQTPPRTAAPPAPVRPAPTDGSLVPDDYDPFADDGPSSVSTTPPAAIPASPPRRPSPSPAAPGATVVMNPGVAPRPAIRRNAPPSDTGLVPGQTAAPRSTAASGASQKRAAPSPQPASNAPAMPPIAERRAAGGASGGLDFGSLLAAAGIDPAQVTPELSEQFGQILRVVVAGLMDVLRSRERIKDEFRMRMTTFKQVDNNPLKYSANVEDALHNLLVKRNAAYLGPVEAFEDAFEDLRNHQMAMLAGMRVAYDAMLTEFEPGHLQEEFDRNLKSGSFLSGPAKLKYWELYRNRFHDMVKDADSSFRNLFGDEFAKAYEEQLVRLRTVKRADRR